MASRELYQELERELSALKSQLEQMRKEKNIVEERYSLATAAAKVGVWDWNIETGDFYLDPNVKAILGYSDYEIPNDLEQWSKYIHPDDKQSVMKAAQDHLDGKTDKYCYEHRMLHKDGSIRWVLVRGIAIRDENGKPIRMNGTDADITKRKKIEEERETLIKDLKNAFEEIISLKGIIPICANCKKMRDDEGYWHQVEMYLEKRSEVKFSHGLCSDCIKELYPEYC